ncbi:MAG: tripartite tricarboxylate transporter substrate binding protein [Phreatobacter sp.]|uniref:Bug family tripartite tricarboxylate transporter substrate binding protein n=1 Tax=Phreatobacter sp. TaxID=1966341 RepID=UPI001A36520E|nr:tripartite tricarboxylate transporter substrate binding protein [Phreatobacter sp.]MBL8570703.1 tripartite tricarboxylate transporter substrate binding protein [Phreatobacter sp.]
MLRRRTLVLSGLLAPLAARAMAYPTRPVSLVVPFAAGGSTDVVARILADFLAPRLRQPIVIENRPGAGGSVALQAVSKAAPDGHTLVVATTGAIVINPHTDNATSNFDPLAGLSPVAKLVDVPMILIANPRSGLKSVRDIVDRSRTAATAIAYGTAGVNSTPHFAMELLASRTRSHLLHVPYRAAPPAVTDVLSGQLPIACVDLTSCLDHIQAGAVLALGVTAAQRSNLLPEVPTFREQAGDGVEITAWTGLFGPPALPREVINLVTGHVAQALADPSVRATIERLGCTADLLPSTQFATMLAHESGRMRGIVQAMKK